MTVEEAEKELQEFGLKYGKVIYIEDEEQEFNIHQDNINGKEINYAEIRPSNEVYPVE